MGTKAPQQLDFIFYFTATEIQRHWCLQTCHSLHLSSLPGIISPASAHKLCSFCSIRLHLFIVPAGWSGLLKTYIVVNMLFIPPCCLGGMGRLPGEILRDGVELTGTAYFSQILPKIADKVCHNNLFTFSRS